MSVVAVFRKTGESAPVCGGGGNLSGIEDIQQLGGTSPDSSLIGGIRRLVATSQPAAMHSPSTMALPAPWRPWVAGKEVALLLPGIARRYWAKTFEASEHLNGSCLSLVEKVKWCGSHVSE